MRVWLRFNAIGVVGFLLQLAVLSLLMRVTRLTASTAVAIAVLVTVSHNFVWHECVTWPNQPAAGRFRRWLAFQLTNGLMSVAANVALTGIVMRLSDLPILAANAIAVGLAATGNFLVSDRWIFAREPLRADQKRTSPPQYHPFNSRSPASSSKR